MPLYRVEVRRSLVYTSSPFVVEASTEADAHWMVIDNLDKVQEWSLSDDSGYEITVDPTAVDGNEPILLRESEDM